MRHLIILSICSLLPLVMACREPKHVSGDYPHLPTRYEGEGDFGGDPVDPGIEALSGTWSGSWFPTSTSPEQGETITFSIGPDGSIGSDEFLFLGMTTYLSGRVDGLDENYLQGSLVFADNPDGTGGQAFVFQTVRLIDDGQRIIGTTSLGFALDMERVSAANG